MYEQSRVTKAYNPAVGCWPRKKVDIRLFGRHS